MGEGSGSLLFAGQRFAHRHNNGASGGEKECTCVDNGGERDLLNEAWC